MTAFTTNLTGTAQLDDSAVLAFTKAYLIAVGQNNVMDAVLQVSGQFQEDIGAKSISINKYPRMAVQTTPLTETDDVVSVAMSDTAIVVTPAEYGGVITTTQLSNLQTGGKTDLAAATVVGLNHGETMNALATAVGEASGNAYIIGGTALGSVTTSQVASDVFLNYFYNKLARLSVPKVNGTYVSTMHDDVITDLRAATAVGSWQDVTKYTTPELALNNEVGMYKGFRIIRNNAHAFADQGTGAQTAVDLYKSLFLGYNALGKATSQLGRIVVSGPFDKLGRFINVGWYEVSKYSIIDTDAIWLGRCASSVGTNA